MESEQVSANLYDFLSISLNYYGRCFLEKYRNCGTAEEITVVQESIIDELEKSWEESRRYKGKVPVGCSPSGSLVLSN